ncbi:hypothetical protein BDN72DRAFT_897678 [Pluteus cervinus]|uniref:Uncharacterized protein n=1 Tax=Pluteus cervinus TaxID=181527 RepID=A0ACD3ATQ3_9AGAR|nr:hypothetical protein BDN72DRAFT_897678 [Pluteus cervinus]
MEQLTSEAPPVRGDQITQIISAAQRGSIKELSILAQSWPSIPSLNDTRDRILRIFLHHLYSTVVPTKPKLDVFGIIEDVEEGRAFWSLWGLAMLAGPLCDSSFGRNSCDQAIVEAWPGIFRWSAFFYTSRVQVSSADKGTKTVSDIRSMRGILRDVIAASWSALALIESVRKRMLDTRGVVDIAARLWVFEDALDIARVTRFGEGMPIATMLLDLLSRSGNQDTLKDIISATGGDIGKIAEASLKRLKRTFKSSEFAANPVESLLVFDLMDRLCRSPNREILKTFLDSGIIPVCIKLLLQLAAVVREGSHNPDNKADFVKLMIMSFQFLRYSLITTKGLPWVYQAIKAGLLTAFVECSPIYADLKQEDYTVVSTTFTKVIPRYLAWLCIVKAMDSAFLKLEETERFLSLPRTRAWEAFNALALLTARRFRVIGQLKQMKNAAAVCNNPKCHKVDVRNNFKKCDRCLVVFYCSKECQSMHWKLKELGHKQKCEEPFKSRKDEMSGRNWQYLLGLNLCETRYNLAALKQLATTKHAGVPFDDLTVVINYSITPAEFSVERLSDWMRDRPDLFPKEEDEETRSCTYIIATIPCHGTKSPTHHVTPIFRGFWETATHAMASEDEVKAGAGPTRGPVVNWTDEVEARRRLYCSI